MVTSVTLIWLQMIVLMIIINVKKNTIVYNVEILIKPEIALKKLIDSFAEIFGEASTEVCEEVIKRHKLISVKSKNIR